MSDNQQNQSKPSKVDLIMPEPSEEAKRSTLSKSIFLLPSLMTLSSMFAGFYGIIAAMSGHYVHTAVAIFIARVFDGLDGRLARLTNTQTEFGAQLDSIADMVSFGLAPAVLIYIFSLMKWGKVGWLIAFLYAACTGLRLAKFNIAPSDKSYFYGLSTPAAAGVVASFVWVVVQYQLSYFWIHYIVLFMTIALSLLKVSSIPYRSFKDVDLKAKVSLLTILLVILILLLVWAEPAPVLLAFFSLYALSGPLFWLISLLRSKKSRA
jgi:CDP-diacylglycerol--serine O-phosphatidyltransferase